MPPPAGFKIVTVGGVVVGVPGPRAEDRTEGRAWHEAAVGTLAFFDEDGQRLKTIYLARMPEPYKATLIGELETELQSVLRERPDLNIVFASDGDRLQWEALDGIVLDRAGNIYGTTAGGGAFEFGTVFLALLVPSTSISHAALKSAAEPQPD